MGCQKTFEKFYDNLKHHSFTLVFDGSKKQKIYKKSQFIGHNNWIVSIFLIFPRLPLETRSIFRYPCKMCSAAIHYFSTEGFLKKY